VQRRRLLGGCSQLERYRPGYHIGYNMLLLDKSPEQQSSVALLPLPGLKAGVSWRKI
jgi:hypothetical protein